MKDLIFLIVTLLTTGNVFAGGETGGGDLFILDFTQTAREEIYPWIKEHGSQLTPPVNAESFLEAISPKDMISMDHVYESCDGSNSGREVDACYNEITKQTVISRTRYPIRMPTSPAKSALVAHEIFRKLKLEGDDYNVSRQMPILLLDPQTQNMMRSTFRGECHITPALKSTESLGTFNLQFTEKEICPYVNLSLEKFLPAEEDIHIEYQARDGGTPTFAVRKHDLFMFERSQIGSKVTIHLSYDKKAHVVCEGEVVDAR